MAAELILKIKVIVGDKEKGWFLHKTRPQKTLKDVAVEILSGGNPCLPLEVVLDMIGIDVNNGDIVQDAEFDRVLTSTPGIVGKIFTKKKKPKQNRIPH